MLEKTRSRSQYRGQKKCPEYLKKIRECGCLICGREAEAAHLRYSSAEYAKVNARDDQWVTPLCPGHHRLYPDAQHNGGEEGFWQRHGIDPLSVASQLWEARDDLEKMQEIAATARTNTPNLPSR